MIAVNPLETEKIVIEGLPFIREEKIWRRLRREPDAPLPGGVESLLWCTAGGQLRFAFRGKTLGVRAVLRRKAGGMDHMASTGEGGVDCYVSFSGCEPQYLATARPTPGSDVYESTLIELEEPALVDVTLNLPLYNGINEVSVLLDDDAELLPPLRKREPGRIVVYGGSIDQGGCANRPGMAYTNILSRWMNTEFINLGFSGNGKAEAEVAAEIAKIPGVTAFVINTAGNCPDAAWLQDHMPRFVQILRDVYPETPILIWQLADFVRLPFKPAERKMFYERLAVEEAVVAERKAAGDAHISIARMDYAASFMGHDISREIAVDGVHPTDLGFMMTAMKLYPLLRDLR